MVPQSRLQRIKRNLANGRRAVIIDADHLCVASRGVNDINSSTTTSSYHGKFLNDNIRQELLDHIRKN
jgi:GTP cyclohydrolase I